MRDLAWRIELEGCSSGERAEPKVANAHHRNRSSCKAEAERTLLCSWLHTVN